jgi:hypothetical protein
MEGLVEPEWVKNDRADFETEEIVIRIPDEAVTMFRQADAADSKL